ncbi:MAG: PAC2 family protein [Actinobacteria bacterium]|nr:PAC2 family protein [Actinomycetota bacterium]
MAPLDPEELYELDPDRPELSHVTMLQALDGFVDAGSTVKLIRDHLRSGEAPRVLARFDVDQLHDYRARRPVMSFDRDHWSGVESPELTIQLLHDAEGVPFLLLAGPEPDAQWERFVAAVRILVGRLGVGLTVGFNAFPMGLPHTRPTRAIVHASRPELLGDYQPWLGQILVPGSAGHLLELRLGESGHDAIGLAAPVPPYVAGSEYPAAAAALLRETGKRTGLRFDLNDLDAAAAHTRLAIDEQVAQNEEVQAVVTVLEAQYDAYQRGQGRSLLAEEGTLPSADELGAELERFLADQARGDNPPQ